MNSANLLTLAPGGFPIQVRAPEGYEGMNVRMLAASRRLFTASLRSRPHHLQHLLERPEELLNPGQHRAGGLPAEAVALVVEEQD